MASDLTADAAVLTSHVLDTATGRPGRGVQIDLFRVGDERPLASAVTNQDGRCPAPLLTSANATADRYRLDFHIGAYFSSVGGFYEIVPVEFALTDPRGHYHVPVVASPWGYSTYRGAPPSRAPDDGANVLSVPNRDRDIAAADAPTADGAGLTTHVIDIAQGRGAGALAIDVFRCGDDPANTEHLARRTTTDEGRTDDWLIAAGRLSEGRYEIVFHLGDYFKRSALATPDSPFFEVARVRFRVVDATSHHHVPLLASPWGYTTYRGS